MGPFDINSLRQKYRTFVYDSFAWEIKGTTLECKFKFVVSPDLEFNPSICVENIDAPKISQIAKGIMDNFVFHLGLAEIPTYWKATCAQRIDVKAGPLGHEQRVWWKELILNGMGEFFYKNKIDFVNPDFIEISAQDSNGLSLDTANHLNNFLVLNGGGRDSVVAIETIKSLSSQISLMMLNPSQASKGVAFVSKVKTQIIVKRQIDEKLLRLNAQGYLNGHTPFSSYLAFLSVLICLMFDNKYILSSNEKSSNEENITYLGKKINHQYSKSIEFEKSFRKYAKDNLSQEIQYLSVVRPLYEIQISEIFSKHKDYFQAFKSCNRGQKSNSWCLQCPKCLSIFISLFPFLNEEETLSIFGKNIYEDESLKDQLLHITGKKQPKPFECVGTFDEMKTGLFLSIKKYPDQLPALLKFAQDEILKDFNEEIVDEVLEQWDENNFLSEEMETLLKEQLHD